MPPSKFEDARRIDLPRLEYERSLPQYRLRNQLTVLSCCLSAWNIRTPYTNLLSRSALNIETRKNPSGHAVEVEPATRLPSHRR